MTRLLKVVVIGILAQLLGGCANTLTVTYHSDPPGATIYQQNQMIGYAPVVLNYPVSKEDKARGYKILSGTSARWASGAMAEVSSLNANLNQYGLNQTFIFQRPDVPGREVDAQFSLQLEQARAAQRQAAAQEQQAAALRQQATAQEERARAERNKIKSPTFCNSTVYGRNVDTVCY